MSKMAQLLPVFSAKLVFQSSLSDVVLLLFELFRGDVVFIPKDAFKLATTICRKPTLLDFQESI